MSTAKGVSSKPAGHGHRRSLSAAAVADLSIHEEACSSVAEYVQRFGGKTVIQKILIANNGIAAVKCMRSIRRWSYEMFGNDRAITVRLAESSSQKQHALGTIDAFVTFVMSDIVL